MILYSKFYRSKVIVIKVMKESCFDYLLLLMTQHNCSGSQIVLCKDIPGGTTVLIKLVKKLLMKKALMKVIFL